MGPVDAIAGVSVIRGRRMADARGSFAKLFQAREGAGGDGRFPVAEFFASWSLPGVLRGMHCQYPPAAHDKAVSCLSGRVLDVVVDLRRSSATFGKHMRVELAAGDPAMVLVPVGCAHGFAVLGEQPALMAYLTTHGHSPDHDGGIHWASFGCDWPLSGEPTVSPRDAGLPPLGAEATPFP
jgi:dTDP-4-dehydrorhamnose 3,5-epimerase